MARCRKERESMGEIRRRMREQDKKARREAYDALNEARAALGLGKAHVPRTVYLGRDDTK